jgi:hypothetical protein
MWNSDLGFHHDFWSQSYLAKLRTCCLRTQRKIKTKREIAKTSRRKHQLKKDLEKMNQQKISTLGCVRPSFPLPWFSSSSSSSSSFSFSCLLSTSLSCLELLID